jgi:hypothetical protein
MKPVGLAAVGLAAKEMKRALERLDEFLTDAKKAPVTLIVGGGGAMVLAYGFPLATSDIDAVPKGMEIHELDTWVKKVASDLSIAPDWLNPYFSTFGHTLPSDYGSRLVEIYRGKTLSAQALGKEDLLIMKCFAHRQKDVGHAKALIKKGADLKQVESQLESLRERGIPGSEDALDFLDDVLQQLEGG